MKEKILFIGNPATFTVGTFVDNLGEQGFECDVMTTTAAIIAKLDPSYKTIILFLDEHCFEEPKLVPAIKSYCEVGEKKLFVIGYDSELAYVLPQFPKNMVERDFARPVSAAEVAAALPRTEMRDEDEKRKHILVVDDSGPMLRSIRSWLEPEYKVTMANSAATALFYLADHMPDLILLDFEMPGCDGGTLLSMLRKDDRTAHIPVIFLTAKDDLDTVLQAAVNKPDGYLLKSQSESKILERIRRFFDERI